MQKDTADSHSVCPGGGRGVYYTIPFSEMFHVHEYSCKHTESLYKLMATEQIVLFLIISSPKQRLEIRLFKYLFSIQMESLTTFSFLLLTIFWCLLRESKNNCCSIFISFFF